MKTGFLMLMIMTGMTELSVTALPVPVMMSSLNVQYSVFSDGKVDREQVLRFDSLFCNAADEVYGRFNTRAPSLFHVSICYGAWIFKSLTGYDSTTAGVYLPDRGDFVFQRPEALASKKIFAAVLRHEILHSACARARELNGIDPEKARAKMWLEEALCTAVYPAGEYSWSRGKALREGKDEHTVRAFIENGMASKNVSVRRDAYALAFVYGSERIKVEGEAAFFARVTE